MGPKTIPCSVQRLFHIGVLATALAAGACSVYLDWDPEGLQCTPGRECDTGYSCLVGQCVGDSTVPLNGTCSKPQQCEGDPKEVTCGSAPNTCRKKCSSGFFEGGDSCSQNQYCRPEVAGGATNGEETTGTCVASECLPEEGCAKPDLKCVPVTAQTNACLLPCSVSFDDDGGYHDNCQNGLGLQQSCQPIGPPDGISFVCLDIADQSSSPEFESETEKCQPVATPCQSGLACVGGECAVLCRDSTQCENSKTSNACVATFGNDMGFGTCSSQASQDGL